MDGVAGSPPACRFCLEDTVEEGDEFIAPCRCSGSMKYVHRSCLDQWRIDGFDPKTVTHCGTCKVRFRLEEPDRSKLGAEGEVWMQIGRYSAERLGRPGCGCPRPVGGASCRASRRKRPPSLFPRNGAVVATVLNHLTLGTASTFALTGGYAVLQVFASINILNLRLDFWRGGGGKDSCFWLLVVLIVVGAAVLFYHLVKGIWEIATVGGHVVTSNLRHANRSMRKDIVRRYRVLNLDQHEAPVPCRRPPAPEQAPASEEPAAEGWTSVFHVAPTCRA